MLDVVRLERTLLFLALCFPGVLALASMGYRTAPAGVARLRAPVARAEGARAFGLGRCSNDLRFSGWRQRGVRFVVRPLDGRQSPNMAATASPRTIATGTATISGHQTKISFMLAMSHSVTSG